MEQLMDISRYPGFTVIFRGCRHQLAGLQSCHSCRRCGLFGPESSPQMRLGLVPQRCGRRFAFLRFGAFSGRLMHLTHFTIELGGIPAVILERHFQIRQNFAD